MICPSDTPDCAGAAAAPMQVCKPGDLFRQRFTGAGERRAVEETVVEELLDDHLEPATGVDVEVVRRAVA